MSLIGIDVGSSSIKIAAYSEQGKLLAVTSNDITPLHPEPGFWEQNPEEIWQATTRGMGYLVREDSVKRDPPLAIAISASGRENFPADSDGNPLGNGIMGADIRGAEFEIPPSGSPTPELWCLSCGHLRERMDPVFRLMWWQKYHPEIMAKSKYFLGWHDLLSMRISGRISTDQSTASRFLVYDLKDLDWSQDRIAEFRVEQNLLPEVLPWPSVIDKIKPDIAEEWGISPDVQLAMGGHDVNCAAVGAGVTEPGTACLISGSYENLLVMTKESPTSNMLLKGLSVMPHPGEAGYSALAVGPTGNAVLNWARDLVDISIEEVEEHLSNEAQKPSPVLAVPYLSGSMTYWEEGRKSKGSLVGLTLASSKTDIVQSFMESIAYDHVNTLALLGQEGVPVTRIRAVGGGSRSEWWTQIKSDLTNRPIEVVKTEEAGTLGAAILAGAAIGVYKDLEAVSKSFSGTSKIYEPNPERANFHKERLEAYRNLVPNLITNVYDNWS